MKKLLLLLAVVVAFSFTAFAQEQSTTTQTTEQTTTKTKKAKKGEAKAAKETTVQGCLAAGTEPNSWTLTKGKKTYTVMGTDMSAHVGHEVKVTGTLGPAEKGKPRMLNATNIEHVADTCTMASAEKAPKAKKNKKGEKGEAATPPGF